MARQVTGNPELTLIDAINDGTVPKPPLMDWNAWQSWRSNEGRRPKMKRDHYTMSNSDEVNLWASIMSTLYGNEWQQRLALRDAPLDDDEDDEDDEDDDEEEEG